MNNKQLNVFIADEDKIMTTALKDDLRQKFGSGINITVFNDAKSCIEKIDDNTHLVILAYDFKKKTGPGNGLEVLKFIRKTHPLTEVVIHSSNDDMGVMLQSIRAGAKGYVVKESNSFSHIRSIIRRRFTEPIRKIITEFGVNKFVAIFLITFVLMGIFVWIAIHKKF
jgi:DNA-binding NarL/FixJ family response regulator